MTTHVAVRGAMGLPVVGMVGGGQLSRMTHQAAIALGLSLRVVEEQHLRHEERQSNRES